MSHSVDCMSPGQPKRWPENLAWHPHGETLFAVYSADGGPQIGIIKTSKSVSFTKQIIFAKVLGLIDYVIYGCWMFLWTHYGMPHFCAESWG